MDDYTFITLAKLKADQKAVQRREHSRGNPAGDWLRLEREQRLAAPAPEVELVETHRRSARTRSFWVGFSPEPKWRQQS